MSIETINLFLLIAIVLLILLQRLSAFSGIESRGRNGRKVILDSCALIDGRIVDLAQSGFVPEQIIIPRFIIKELQLLADGNDTHKRERARFGLDIARQLQASKFCDVAIDATDFSDLKQVDDKLVALAKKRNAMLYTVDFNLNKVAEIEAIRVLNVHELAQNLRPSSLPGEQMTLKIMQKGSNKNQGIGYLDDGTMVVVENGMKHIGERVTVETTRVFQTVAGKMIFAMLVSKNSSEKDSRNGLKTPKKMRSRR